MKYLFSLLFATILFVNSYAQTLPPKREFRAAWVATVENLDWPSTQGGNSDNQKKQLTDLFDALQKANINVVIFQVRAECDAFYASNYEPWSKYLTGTQGTPPSPLYDPLQFAIEEAHKRGMELHAWFNPYRAVKSVGSFPIAGNHVSVLHPDWVIQISSFKFLNPGLPDVRQYVTKVIMDVVSRYDIDGVHMDDYFYPYPSNNITNQDTATFRLYSRGFTNINDWRRDNVNILIKTLNDSIHAVKPFAKFGISPFGIWKSGVPSGISGLSAYSDIYCDAIAWLQQQSIDYLTPQLYWVIGGGQDYLKLSKWWSDSVKAHNRHFYPGEALYRMTSWGASEIPNQIRIDRANPNTGGQVFFRAYNVIDNIKGCTDTLKNDLYKKPALLPVMNWKDTTKPGAPANLTFGRLAGKTVAGLKWNAPSSVGNATIQYVLYNFPTSNIQPSDLNTSANIYMLTSSKEINPANITGNYFVVTALSKNYVESNMSNVVQITAPQVPVTVLPANNAVNQRDTLVLKWQYAEGAGSYNVQVSTDPTFSTGILYNSTLADTSLLVTKMTGQTKYYWRVKAMNIAGESAYSSVYNFTTGFPIVPVLKSPAHASINLDIPVQVKWGKEPTAATYRLQLSKSQTFNDLTILADIKDLTDTCYTFSTLIQNTTYFWRVDAINQYGASAWPTAFGFKTKQTSDVKVEAAIPNNMELSQNYPNPFNPTTQIKYSVPKAGYVTLKLYNLLGDLLQVMVDGYRSEGTYQVTFDGSKLSSGVYIYSLSANGQILNHKMTLVK